MGIVSTTAGRVEEHLRFGVSGMGLVGKRWVGREEQQDQLDQLARPEQARQAQRDLQGHQVQMELPGLPAQQVAVQRGRLGLRGPREQGLRIAQRQPAPLPAQMGSRREQLGQDR